MYGTMSSTILYGYTVCMSICAAYLPEYLIHLHLNLCECKRKLIKFLNIQDLLIKESETKKKKIVPPTKGQLNISVSASLTESFCISPVNQSCWMSVASGSSGSRALMLACSGTTRTPHSLWAAAKPVHTASVIDLDPDSLKDC